MSVKQYVRMSLLRFGYDTVTFHMYVYQLPDSSIMCSLLYMQMSLQ